MMRPFTVVKLSEIDLNLLLVLDAVLEERSVSRAARRLHVTPPAVSNALARLRGIVGDPLVVRQGRGIVPTPRALELAPVLRRALVDIEASLQRGELDPAASTRTLTLAISDADQIASLSRIARAFARRLPRARLRVVSLDTLVSSGGLAGDEVDAAIGPPFEGDGIHRTFLLAEEGVLVARKGHPRLRRTLTAAQFDAERHVDIHLLLGRGGIGNAAVRDAIAEAGLRRDVAITVPTFIAAAAVVAATDLVSGMPRRVVQALARSFPLQILRAPGPSFAFELNLHWHDRTAHDPAARAFRAAILDAIGTRPGR